MAKIKPIEISNNHEMQNCRMELVGYPQTKNSGLPYIRLETFQYQYIGSLDQRQVRRLKNWCEKALGLIK